MAYLIVFMIIASPVIALVEVISFQDWFLSLYSIAMSLIGLSILFIWEHHKERISNLEKEVERLKELQNG